MEKEYKPNWDCFELLLFILVWLGLFLFFVDEKDTDSHEDQQVERGAPARNRSTYDGQPPND